MSSRFQAAVLVSAPCYPNAVAWSEENLVAVASGSLVTILNPAKPSGAGCRGVISVLPSKPFSIGVINDGGIDFLSGCLLPMHVSRDTRPCVRSISWSPAGLASNAGCLLAVCTTGGRVKLYRFPFCDFSAEWIEVMDISEMMYNFLSKINFGESQIISSESLDVIGSRDNAESECPNEPPVSSLRKERKRRRQNETNVAAKKLDNVKENNTWEIIPISVSEGTPLKIKECNVQLITAQQYASRNAMLTPLIVAWSPILRTSEDWVSIPHNSSGCCSILATGLKCGLISFWRIDAPESYSIITPELPCKASNGGFLKAHDTCITSICWALYGSEISKPQLLLATGSSNGRVKIWRVNIKELLKSSETVHASFSLLREVITVDSAPVSILSFTAPLQTPLNLFLAIGKGSGSFEVWTMNMTNHEFEIIGCYSAHDHIVTGLAWAFDGLCLYSCSQDNSMKAWNLVGKALREIHIPSNTPDSRFSLQVPYVYDSCFGLAVSHGSLAIAVARRFDSDLLNPMYQERTQKAAIEFLWIGGQQLDTSSNICFDIDFGSFPGFPEVELIWWEKNILWSLSLCGSFSGLLNIWDIVAALVSFKQSIPNYVEHILQKWLTSYFGSNFCICTTFLSTAFKILPTLSTRKLHLINVIIRHVVLKNDEVSESRKHQDLERFSSAIEEQTNVWKELQLCCENELRRRLVGLYFSAILDLLSDVPTNFCDVGCWHPDECPQLEHYISLHEKIVEDDLKFLAAKVGKIKKRRESFEYEEHCCFCSAIVPFESIEYAICSGVKNGNGVDQTHKLHRCSVSMQLCPAKYSWFCMCCQRRASKLAPLIFFTMPLYPSNFKSFFESSAFKKSFSPCCPLCGILLQRLQPEYLLSPSPV
ncbi:uncharacterized protein LOC142522215 isoform X2 [Primulina tabacum]|uniref:uncharacterized protein LOC142522215 isoform X2 n=1 Tax=Primulina tabacum TaxID=48773 RepID=UPI003F59B0AA